MIRLPLNKGDTIQLNNRQYIIDSVIGDGATCIVYSAYYTDSIGHLHRVNLKECYPYNAAISREGAVLHWDSEDEQQRNLALFRNAYEKLMVWQNENFAVHVFDLCEANHTLYIIMTADKGTSFDKDSFASLQEIFSTLKLLTHFVGIYHENGYLHLDIKPSNFLVYPRPSEHIVLFDMDTVTPIDDIRSGIIKYSSYSDAWAAPEQKQGKISKFCPATDLYAIGAILFERIMGRPVSAADMSLFADWEFDGKIFDNVNPKVKRYLREIFRQTLAANVKRRYQTAIELESILAKACDTVRDGKPYLSSDCPPVGTQFVGRESEIQKIHDTFHNGKRAIFLHGVGGIGKSSLALAYAAQYRKEYDAILFLRYRDSLEELLNEIVVQNCTDDREKRKILRKLLDSRILLIVDNFDVEIDQDEYLGDLLREKAHILFTTRTDFSSIYGGDVVQIEIGNLPEMELVQIFETASGRPVHEKQMPYLHKLLKMVDYHTYVTELLGKQIAVSGCTLESLALRMEDGILEGLTDAEKVRTQKDGQIVKKTIPEILRIVFRIADLDEPKKQVLRNLYLLRFLRVDKSTYCEFTYERTQGINVFNDLLETGWIIPDGIYYKLHPLVEDLIKTDLKPCQENCIGIYARINSKIQDCIDYDGYDDTGEYTYDRNSEMLCVFFNYLDFSISSNRQMAIKWLRGVIDNEGSLGSYEDYYYGKVYNKLSRELQFDRIDSSERFEISYIIVCVWGQEFLRFRIGETSEEREKREQKRLTSYQAAFETAKKAASQLPQEKQEDSLDLLYSSVPWGPTIKSSSLPLEYILRLYNEHPAAFDFGIDDKRRLGLPITEEELAEEQEFDAKYNASDESDDPKRCELLKAEIMRLNGSFSEEDSCSDLESTLELLYKKQFHEAKDKVAYAKMVVGTSGLPEFDRAKYMSYCTDVVFERFHYPIHIPSKNYTFDWDELEQVLEIEEDFLISDTWKRTNWQEHQSWKYYLQNNTANQIIVYAAMGDRETFEDYLKMLMDDEIQDAKRLIEHGSHWSHFVSLKDHLYLTNVVNGLVHLKRQSWIVDHLIAFAQQWEEYASKHKDFSEEALFPIYKTISECAENAELEDGLSKDEKKRFRDICWEYQDKIESIAGTSYILRLPEE